MIHVWKVDGDQLVLNKEELLKYPPLAEIFRRDEYPGKPIALKEFRYIDLIANKNGYCVLNGLSKKEAHEYAVKYSGLNKDYQPDAKIKAAINCVFNDINTTVVEKSIQSIIKALNNASKLAAKIEDALDQKVELAVTNDSITECLELINKLGNLAKGLPGYIKTLSDLQQAWEKEQKGTTVRGGRTYSTSLDGDDELGFDDAGVDRID